MHACMHANLQMLACAQLCGRLGFASNGRPHAYAWSSSQADAPASNRLPLTLTGIPDDVFVHDVTEAVEYRGVSFNVFN